MKLAQTLIDNAVKVCGSQSELGRRVGIYPADITNLKKGKRTLTPELAALIAEEAHMDAKQAYIDAAIQRDLADPSGGKLAQILGKAMAGGVAAMSVSFCAVLLSGVTTTEAAAATVKNDSVSTYNATHRIKYVLLDWVHRVLSAGHAIRKSLLPASGSPFVFQ